MKDYILFLQVHLYNLFMEDFMKELYFISCFIQVHHITYSCKIS